MIKANKTVSLVVVLMLVIPVLLVSGCAGTGVKHKYAGLTPSEILLMSHNTPSDSEKILLRDLLAKNHPNTVEGMYARAYIEYKNGNRANEKKIFNEMLKKYPDNADVIHYQSFMGDLENKLKATRKGFNLHPSYLEYNFLIHLADFYIENKEALATTEFIKEVDLLEKKMGSDIYIFDYVRGMVEKNINEDHGKAVAYYASALEKKGALARATLWKDYFENKYPVFNSDKEVSVYISEVKKVVEKIQGSALSQLKKNVVSHEIYKQMAEKIRKGYALTDKYSLARKFFEKANSYYYTIEVVSGLRTNYIRMKREDKILPMLESAVKKLPENPDANGLLAMEYADTYQYEKSHEYYKKAIKYSVTETDKKHYVTLYSRKVLLNTYRASEAVDLIKKVSTELNDRSEIILKSLAEAYFYAGNYDAAKDVLAEITKELGKGVKPEYVKKAENLVLDYIKRDKGENVVGESKKKREVVLATTAVNADWVTMSPDGLHFLANDGGSNYMLWDSKVLNVVDKYNGAILNRDYVEYMTKPVFSPNGRYIAYASEYKDDRGNVALIYDLKERRFSHQLPMYKEVSALVWSPDSTEVIIWNYGRLIKYSLKDKKVITQGAVLGQDGAGYMKLTSDGKYLALLESSSKGSIRIYNPVTLQQLHRLDQVSWPHALGVSKDGRYIFSADNRYKLHRWDATKKFEHKKISIPVLASLIEPHPSKKEILINDWSDKNKLLTVDYEKFEIINSWPTGNSELRIHYIDKGKKILAVNVRDDEYEIRDSSSLKLIKTYKGESAVVTGGAYANTALNQLVVWDQEGLNVWNVETGKKTHQWKGVFESVAKDKTNSNILYAFVNDVKSGELQLKKYDLRSFESKYILTPDFEINEWGVDGESIVLSGAAKSSYYKTYNDGRVMIVNSKTHQSKNTIIKIMTRPLTRYESHKHAAFRLTKASFKHVAVSPDEKFVAVSTAWSSGWKSKEEKSKFTRIIEVATGKEIQSIKKVGALVFKNNNELAIALSDKVKKGAPVYSVVTGKRTGWLGEGYTESVVATHNKWKDEVEFEAQNLKIKVESGNKLIFNNRANSKHVLTIVAKRNNEWIAYLPSGEYAASENGANKVVWRDAEGNINKDEVIKRFKKEDVIKVKLRYTRSDRTK